MIERESDIFNTELGKKLLALTKAIFKVSNLISDLTVRDQIKSKALNIYENFCNGCDNPTLLKELGALDNILRLSGHLGMIEENHSKILRNGYLVFKSHVIVNSHESSSPKIAKAPVEKRERIKEVTVEKRSDPIMLSKKTGERHERIMEHLKNNEGQARLSDIAALFPNLSEKSVRNDLAHLCGQGKIKRAGWGVTSFYKMND